MKPILFNTNMVCTILEDRKTVTRRVVRGYALDHLELDTDGSIIGVYNQDEGRVFPMMNYAPCHPGDILYVRETWGLYHQEPGFYVYKADKRMGKEFDGFKWRPSIHMPREAARIFLWVTDVRVERLQDIDDEGAKAEGVNWRNGKHIGFEEKMRCSAIDRFAEIWNSIIKPADRALYGWDANPWVWAIEFERISREEALA